MDTAETRRALEPSPPPIGPGATLDWTIRSSLLAYVAGMSDGSIDVVPPATARNPVTEEGFSFPEVRGVGEGRHFGGGAILSGHGGLLHLVIAEPSILIGDAGSILTIADPHLPGERLAFATIDRLLPDTAGDLVAQGTRLSAEGAELFFAGPYTEGYALDNPRIVSGEA